MFRTPSRIHSTHTCTCAQSLHIVVAVACVVAHPELARSCTPVVESANLSHRARVDEDSPDLVVHRWWEEGLEHPEEDGHKVACAVVDSLPIVREVVAAEACSHGVVGSLDACPGRVGRESREGRSGLLGKLKDLWAHLC